MRSREHETTQPPWLFVMLCAIVQAERLFPKNRRGTSFKPYQAHIWTRIVSQEWSTISTRKDLEAHEQLYTATAFAASWCFLSLGSLLCVECTFSESCSFLFLPQFCVRPLLWSHPLLNAWEQCSFQEASHNRNGIKWPHTLLTMREESELRHRRIRIYTKMDSFSKATLWAPLTLFWRGSQFFLILVSSDMSLKKNKFTCFHLSNPIN